MLPYAAVEPGMSIPKYLDGFALLDACGIDLPNEATSACAASKSYVDVIHQDLRFFTRLTFLDVSDNCLRLEHFCELPALRDLRLPCNGISEVPSLQGLGFGKLRCLDLSYNSLSVNAILPLASLPTLRELDLSGNTMQELPDMSMFDCLETLVLEDNKFEGGDVFLSLSGANSLREVSLAYNYLSHIPETLRGRYPFAALEGLDLAHNYVKTQQSLVPAVRWPRLKRLLVYGNPLLGASGMDPLGLCVDYLATEAILAREGSLQSPVQVVTEAPQQRTLRRRASALKKRQIFYDGVRIIDVKNEDMRTSKSFREAGNQTLFEQAMTLAQKAVQSTRSIESARDTFITGVDAGGLHVADEINSILAQTEAQATDVLAQILRRTEDAQPEGQSDAIRHEDTLVPTQLLRRSLANPAPFKPKSCALQAAVKALRFALEHPLTSDVHVPGRGEAMGFMRPTANAKSRQQKRIAYVPTQTTAQRSQEAMYLGRVDGTHIRYEGKLRQERAKAMLAMEQILDELHQQQSSTGVPTLPEPTSGGASEPHKARARVETHRPSSVASMHSLIAMVEEVVDFK